jgi:hypothetical protein
MMTWLNVQEAAGMLAAMLLVFAGLWYGFPGPAFRSLMRRAARGKRGAS